MTAQFSDDVNYKGKIYSIIGIEGTKLFDPSVYNLKANIFSTACYRGYYCTFSIIDDHLYLTELTVLTDEKKPIEGHLPKINSDGEACYKKMKLPIPFSGKLRIVKDFIKDRYVHMGYQSATAFKEVWDLQVEKGKITLERDRSEDAEKMRSLPPPPQSDLGDWIGDRFSLKLEWD